MDGLETFIEEREDLVGKTCCQEPGTKGEGGLKMKIEGQDSERPTTPSSSKFKWGFVCLSCLFVCLFVCLYGILSNRYLQSLSLAPPEGHMHIANMWKML